MYSIISGVYILIFISGISIAADSNYPSELTKCRVGDNKCITEVVQTFARNYSDGIPSINLPSLDPLFVGRIDAIREKKMNIFNINTMEHMNWRSGNVKLYGLKNSTITITGFEKALNDSNVIITMLIPNATYTADYDLNFKFLQRQINGLGKLRFVFENFEFRWSFISKIYEKDDGKQYMRIDQPEIDYTFTAANINFGLLYDGIENISRLDNVFLNQNGKILIEVTRPECSAEFARSFTEIIEPIFSKFSIDQLFLIDE